MNELPPLPLDPDARARIRGALHHAARAARVHAGEVALHVGFSAAALLWALGLLA
jgi:hypothetical protein